MIRSSCFAATAYPDCAPTTRLRTGESLFTPPSSYIRHTAPASGRPPPAEAADSPYNAHYERPATLAALGPVRGLRVLDAACGPGLYTQELLARGAVVMAFDASPVMVDLARARIADQAQVDQAVLGQPLPYPDGAFDLIVCALAIHVWHMEAGDQPVRFWREPLSALCGYATGAGFLIEAVIEPLPAETMRGRYPDDYQKLTTEPGFLILRLVKPRDAIAAILPRP